MASTVSENGDTREELAQSTENSGLKVNGEVNGSYEEPMEVDDDCPVKSVKKVNSSDINCISETAESDSHSESDLNQQKNSVSEDSIAEINTEVESEVPEVDEATSSNGYGEQHEESKNEEEEEENTLEEKLEGSDDRNMENSEGNVEDEDVMLMEEDEPQDPLAADTNSVEEADEVNIKDTVMESSDNEHIDSEENDPFAAENDQSESLENNENYNNEDEKTEDLSKKHDNNEKNKNSEEESKKMNTEESPETEENSEKIETEKVEEDKEDDKNEDSFDKSKSEEDSEKTPEKGKKKKIQQQPINITPRRSSRNVNKPKTYINEPDIKGNSIPAKKASSDDPDIEEIVPQDPLAMDSPVSDKKNKKTVVVNDPKRLVEIASGNKQSQPGKKEPTLVIIDTNSILSGRGPVPVSPSPPLAHSSNVASSSRTQGYSVLPMALPAQGMYPQAIRHSQMKPVVMPQGNLPVTPPPSSQKPPVILPSLTDDMYVVEAPSFIVPYVYEKPPIKPLKNFVDQVEQAIKEIKAQLEKEKVKEEDNKKGDDSKTNDESDKKGEDKDEKDENVDKEASKEEKEVKEDKEEKMEVDSEETKTSKDGEGSVSTDDKETKDSEKTTEAKSAESKTDCEKLGEDVKSEEGEKTKKQSNSYFDNPLGKFFIQIGVNLVQEHVQTDLLRSQKRKKEREGSKCTPEVQQAMNSLIRSLEFSKETNEPFKLELKKCEFCSFKTESALVMAHHLETPHMRNYVYRCNFCPLEVRSPHDILYHMEAEHNVRGRLERAPAFHQCPSCPFEDNQKGKLSRHLLSCAKKYRPERNQEPPLDFEPPAKIPRVSRNRPTMSPGTPVYQAAMSGLKQGPGHPLLPKLVPAPTPPGLIRGRGRPQMINRYLGDMRSPALAAQQKAMAAQMRPGMIYRPSGSNAQPQVLLPASYQLAGTQLYQDQMSLYQQMNAAAVASKAAAAAAAASVPAVGATTAKLLQQPSISITPLPRQAPPPPAPSHPSPPTNKPGRPAGGSKATFVICEICDGYIKDLEQLRNHMQWIHKVKIHPKMIYNRPPLNCQKCQFRFFTDQGLERHLLGSHGLVTSSMQEAANKGKDGGRCPVCGRVYQWKLLNHVARDHNMSLKPAHLSYKCTVCTATFGMYKQFENHVYSAHSVVAKRVMDKKPSTSAQPSTSSQGDMLKPLKINDEITIIPQPARTKTKPTGSNRNPQKKV
ncbi:MOG interacting and ectopic P-granules protein 1 isoform X3 [Homalodisca vitripennis]|uniref:MOG interacting and ectopic P-granules protein 1 isoform X3 n=1 Tax=Homalodisca vitripennis TaxID=197043 RepID=UPI001EEAB231|nr:MOG interacting and ectopic P-granules protein 1 isoform X3 [Homalodisca vitripennis]